MRSNGGGAIINVASVHALAPGPARFAYATMKTGIIGGRPFALASCACLERRLVKDGPGVRFRIINAVPERHTRYLLPLYTFPAFWPYWVYFDFHAEPLY